MKTDKNGNSLIIVYVGHNVTDSKAHFGAKLKKLQLTSDHKDMDPAKALTRIEVTLKDLTSS